MDFFVEDLISTYNLLLQNLYANLKHDTKDAAELKYKIAKSFEDIDAWDDATWNRHVFKPLKDLGTVKDFYDKFCDQMASQTILPRMLEGTGENSLPLRFPSMRDFCKAALRRIVTQPCVRDCEYFSHVMTAADRQQFLTKEIESTLARVIRTEDGHTPMGIQTEPAAVDPTPVDSADSIADSAAAPAPAPAPSPEVEAINDDDDDDDASLDVSVHNSIVETAPKDDAALLSPEAAALPAPASAPPVPLAPAPVPAPAPAPAPAGGAGADAGADAGAKDGAQSVASAMSHTSMSSAVSRQARSHQRMQRMQDEIDASVARHDVKSTASSTSIPIIKMRGDGM